MQYWPEIFQGQTRAGVLSIYLITILWVIGNSVGVLQNTVKIKWKGFFGMFLHMAAHKNYGID